MFNNPYQQANLDNINRQISELERLRTQVQQSQPTNLTQNFQIAPTNHNGMKYANSIEDIQKEFVISETPFISRDYSNLWIKNAKGEIRTFRLEEVIPKDEKDTLIEDLQNQINILNKKIEGIDSNEQYYVKQNDEYGDEYESKQSIEPIKSTKSSNVSSNRTSKSKSK